MIGHYSHLIAHKLTLAGSIARHLLWDLWPYVHKVLIGLMTNRLEFTIGFKLSLLFVSVCILGQFFIYFFVNNFLFIGEYIKSRWVSSFMFGVATIPLAILLGFVTFGTTLGILFLPALLFIFVFTIFFGFYATALVVGEKISKIVTLHDHPARELFLGTLALGILGCIPYIGLGLVTVANLIGIGAVVKLKFGVRGV
jgi:hypothetical protein